MSLKRDPSKQKTTNAIVKARRWSRSDGATQSEHDRSCQVQLSDESPTRPSQGCTSTRAMTARRRMILSLTAATLGLAVLVSICVGGAARRLMTGDSSDTSCDTAPIRFTLKAPRLDALTLDCEPWGLDRLRGKVVLVHFWATWCAPCLDQIPTIQALQDWFGGRGDFKIVNVGIASSPGELRATAARHRMPGEIVRFPGKIDDLPPGFRVWGLPTTWLISRTGRMGPAPLEKEGVPDLVACVLASGE